jgi:hypothetical protein
VCVCVCVCVCVVACVRVYCRLFILQTKFFFCVLCQQCKVMRGMRCSACVCVCVCVCLCVCVRVFVCVCGYSREAEHDKLSGKYEIHT